VNAAIPLFLTLTTTALGITDDHLDGPADDFSPVIFFAMMIFLCVLLFLIVAGIAAGIVVSIVAIVSAALLTALGIVSSSAFIGVFRRRFSSGLRALHYQICAVAAVPAGMGAVGLGSRILHASLPLHEILTVGAIAGVCAGLVLAFAFDILARIAYRHLTKLAAAGQRKMSDFHLELPES
jgi:hypothetical protein